MFEEITPQNKPRIIELVEKAGLDVKDWAAGKDGQSISASNNPARCFEWSFVQGDLLIVNIWLENMQQDSRGIFQSFNPLTQGSNKKGLRKGRARRFFETIQLAHRTKNPVRAIILDRKTIGGGQATGRLLDEEQWFVTKCADTGEFELRRGNPETSISESEDPEVDEFDEAQKRKVFVTMRKREWKYRNAKISAFLKRHGRLFCEVPGCGFDFEHHYGEVGKGFAEVHHLDQMKDAPDEGRKATLERLAVVCSNCHRMIHRGGESRSLKEVSPMGVAHV